MLLNLARKMADTVFKGKYHRLAPFSYWEICFLRKRQAGSSMAVQETGLGFVYLFLTLKHPNCRLASFFPTY